MANPSVARPLRQPRFSGLAWRRARWGYVFIAPWIIGFLAFTAIPMIATLVFSFTIRHRVIMGDEIRANSALAKLVALVSLLLWSGVGFAGKAIGYIS